MANTNPAGVPTLQKVCLGVLIRWRHALSDVGYLESQSLRSVLGHCGEDELRHIEDSTKSGLCQRDLSWYTWDFWHKRYEHKFGTSMTMNADLIPLPGKPPEDYQPPLNGKVAANWRRMLQRDIEAEKAKANSASNRLRDLYENAHKNKASKSVEVCIIAPPRKRMRTMNGPVPGPSALVDKTKAKMMYDIGLNRPRPTAITGSGANMVTKTVTKNTLPRPKSVGGGQMKVTKTVTVYKAQSAPAPAPVRPGTNAAPGQSGGSGVGNGAGTNTKTGRPGSAPGGSTQGVARPVAGKPGGSGVAGAGKKPAAPTGITMPNLTVSLGLPRPKK